MIIKASKISHDYNGDIALKNIDLEIKKENPKTEWKYNYETDACFDIQSNEDVIIPARGRYAVSTGVSLSIPDGYMATKIQKLLQKTTLATITTN